MVLRDKIDGHKPKGSTTSNWNRFMVTSLRRKSNHIYLTHLQDFFMISLILNIKH